MRKLFWLLLLPTIAYGQRFERIPVQTSSRPVVRGLRLSITPEWVRTNNVEPVLEKTCENFCDGGHTSRADCNKSCSPGCTTEHWLYMESDYSLSYMGCQDLADAVAASGGLRGTSYLANCLEGWASDLLQGADDGSDDL